MSRDLALLVREPEHFVPLDVAAKCRRVDHLAAALAEDGDRERRVGSPESTDLDLAHRLPSSVVSRARSSTMSPVAWPIIAHSLSASARCFPWTASAWFSRLSPSDLSAV